MNIPTKKLVSGFEMPIFGLGTWEMGGREERDLLNDDKRDISAIETCIEMGIHHLDTAEKYADGYAETLVGKAIQNQDRSSLFLVSKVAPFHLKHQDVIKAAKESLKRMKISYFDLYLIHGPNFDIPLKESIEAMNELVDEGLTKYIGVSNFSVNRLKESQQYSKHPIVVNQVHYNLQMREVEQKGLLEYCQKNDVILEAYRPIQKALLEMNDNVMQEMVSKYKKTPIQIALNWLLSQKNVVTISKMSKRDHIEENLGAIGWEMKAEDIERLRSEYPNQRFESEVAPLIDKN